MAASSSNSLTSCLRLAVFVLVVLASTHAAFADGKVFRQAVADFSHVPMPDQRALIVWNEHGSAEARQTLVIESGFTAQPGSSGYAWVLPLPAPAAVLSTSKGIFPTLQALAAPRVHVADGGGLTWMLIWVIIAITIWAYAAKGWSKVAGGLAALLLVAVGLLPALGTARSSMAGPPSAQVQIIDRTLVGAQEVTQVTGGAAALRAWLAEQGVAVDDAVGKAVDAYVADGWIFAAVRLAPQSSDEKLDLSTPPIVFSFPTRQPVYPMRLTGANGGKPLDLQLYVMGPGTAAADGLRCVTSAPVSYAPPRHNRWIPPASEAIELSHPQLRTLAAPSAHFTQLRGTLEHAAMQEDVAIRFSEPALVGRHAMTTEAARQRAVRVGLLVLFVAVVWAHLWEQRKPADRRPRRRWAIAWACAASAIGGGVSYAVTPTIEVVKPDRARRGVFSSLAMQLAVNFATGPVTLAEVRAAARQLAAEYEQETGAPVREGDAPMEYQIEAERGKGFLVWIDPIGRAHREELYYLEIREAEAEKGGEQPIPPLTPPGD